MVNRCWGSCCSSADATVEGRLQEYEPKLQEYENKPEIILHVSATQSGNIKKQT